MPKLENKKPGTSRSDASAIEKNKPFKPAPTPPGKDPDEYDPVGMAGKPAGILLELGEEASEEAKAPISKDKAGRTVPDTKDNQDS